MNDRDFAAGVSVNDIPAGAPLFGKLGDDAIMLVRSGEEIIALGATCTHYNGPLPEGVVSDGVIRCPWHHACFSLRTGEAIAAPALNPLPRWTVAIRDGTVHIGKRIEEDPLETHHRTATGPESVVIIGGGGAGSAAAEMLRREGYTGPVTIVDPDADAPYDRPNLSKDYLNGHAPEEWLPLRPPTFYAEHNIARVVASATEIDTAVSRVLLDNGQSLQYGALLLATGAAPIKPKIPGADLAHVHVLRSLADCRTIIESAKPNARIVVVGASFIGMEVAASLKQRELDVTVVAPEAVPFARVLGEQLGAHLRSAHEKNGVKFRLGRSIKAITAKAAILDDDSSLECDVVILGIGVHPLLSLAESAGLAVDNGVVVDQYLESSVPNIYAAGDIARVPDPRTGESYRVEHWVVAQRLGQTAARNILGRKEPYERVPFFWTQQFDVVVSYVGHAMEWDRIDVDGDLNANDCTLSYRKGDDTLAVVTLGRDRVSLRAELSMEQTS